MLTNVKVTNSKSGAEVKIGDTVVDFRGESATFQGVTRFGRTGTPKIAVDDGWGCESHEYYAHVFDLEVEEI